MDLLTEMRMPTRSAPRPPAVDGLSNGQRSSTPSNLWSSASSNDLFGSSLKVPQKKKPPPRPPPPKFPPKYNQTQEKPKKPARPTELLSNLFGRRVSKPQSTVSGPMIGSSITRQQQQLPTSAPKPSSEASVCLIDLSPPGSPTFTTRSSSDGVSVDSFGSDGNSNPSAFASSSSGSASQTESAFEDDFDFFGGLAAAKKQQAASVVVDPWRVSCSQDPFGSFEPANTKSAFTAQQQWPVTSGSQVREIGESSFFAFNDVASTASSSASGSPFDSPSKPSFKMPTIIRPRKPRKDEEVKPKPAPYTSSASSNNYASAPRPPGFMQARLNENASQLEKQQPASLTDWPDDEEPSSPSPPMPKLPPPPPPPEYIAGLEDGLVENSERPYGIALYDFPASQSDDLELKEGDLVYLTKIINDSWMEGRVGCREGMFPINFVDVKIPLPGLETNVVTALYSFKAETADDLSFEDGARIKVLSRVSDDWLYGEYQGKKGQFPANFVDKIPNDLPNHL